LECIEGYLIEDKICVVDPRLQKEPNDHLVEFGFSGLVIGIISSIVC